MTDETARGNQLYYEDLHHDGLDSNAINSMLMPQSSMEECYSVSEPSSPVKNDNNSASDAKLEKPIKSRRTSFDPMSIEDIRNAKWAKIPTRIPKNISSQLKEAYVELKAAEKERETAREEFVAAERVFEEAKLIFDETKKVYDEAKKCHIDTEGRFQKAYDLVERQQLQEKCTWNTMYHQLVEFKAKQGNFVFGPEFRNDPEKKKLRDWISRQKDMYRKYLKGDLKTCRPDRITALEKIGLFVSKWDQKFNELLKFKEIYGHCNVPTRNHKEYKYLGGWVGFQRGEYKNFMEGRPSTITQERIDRLSAIDFVWSPFQANGWKQTTREYYKKRAKPKVEDIS